MHLAAERFRDWMCSAVVGYFDELAHFASKGRINKNYGTCPTIN